MADMETKNPGVHPKIVRLNRFLAMAGLGSRRKMDELISSGRVALNGTPVSTLGIQVRPGKDVVTVDGSSVDIVDKDVYILLNKPKDCITTLSDERGRKTVLDYVHVKQRIYPVGRLDRNTTGVLLLMNDGELANALLHPRFEVERLYKVSVEKNITQEDLRALRKGVRLEDGIARVKDISQVEKKKVVLVMAEGRNREVRRMFEARDHEVRQLDRMSYAGLTARGLPRGSWRFLSREEVRHLRQQTGLDRSPSTPRTRATRKKRK